MYSSQGDCIYLIIDAVDPAIEQTICFLNTWFEEKGTVPDCRAVIAFDHLDEIRLLERIELLSKGFEELSLIEKHAYEGQILVTENAAKQTSKYKDSFIDKGFEELGDTERFKLYQLSYDDPRIRNGRIIYGTEELEDLDEGFLREFLSRCSIELLAVSLHGLSPKSNELFKKLLTPGRREDALLPS